METETPSFNKILKHPFLLNSLEKKMGFSAPTAIQMAVAPSVLEGRNLFAGAKTGSGKTMAFLAPICERILNGQAKRAFILAPTRELVLQIDEEAFKLLEGQNECTSVPLYGGVPIDPQILAIRHHRPKIFIATPGRALDLIGEEMIPLSEIEICVLDEADRMCDMGFAPQVTNILELLTNCKQMLLFSATLPKQLSDMMSRFCPDPVRIQVDAADESSATIEHNAIFCTRRDKGQRLLEVIQDPGVTAIVFARTRHGASALHKSLERQVKGMGILHAGFSMGDRERTIRAFREGDIRILIATDVVSRGIDVDRITHVIHYDLPDSLEDYIHRSGRSGRAGRAGQTIAFFERDNPNQMEVLRELKKKVHFQANEKEEAAAQRPQAPNADGPREHRPSRPHQGNRTGQNRRPGSRPPRSNGPRTHSPHPAGERKARPEGERPVAARHAAATPTQKKSLLSKTKSLIGKLFRD